MEVVDLYVITDDVSLNFPLLREGIKPNVISKASYDYSSLFHDDRLPQYVYYRWEIFNNSIFRGYDRVLYLDVDTEVERDISELFGNETLDGVYSVPERVDKLIEQGFVTSKRYDNSGVILITPQKLGKSFLDSLFMDLVKAAQSHTFMWKDQCAMNYVLNMPQYFGKWRKLDCTYNYFTATKDDITCAKTAKILHRAGGDILGKRRKLRFID